MSILILTHEQADFDAVASVWAAHRLHTSATPVLPRRVNRNVRAFLNLYGEHFPFTPTEDLPRRAVARVIVVDAQSVSSVKGMSAKTEITVIDHHDASTLTVGANTTLLVEQLADSRVAISPIEATLFLLGIYEDTGSLAYITTTPRDARAAARLLEAGARLDTVREFLQHPLTPGQRALFDQLLAAAETHTVNGQSLVVTAVDAGESDEELSALAHKLRDTYEAAGVIMLVALQGREPRVQLVARSVSGNVDVASLAQRFGGGGHTRAAAALVRGRELAEVHAALVAALPDSVTASATVGEIMSRGVQTLAPGTSVREAAARMKRYGYEGYPVVDDGHVLGLLTRRAVDRAIHHHLDSQPISTIMESGSVTVAPGDSIEHLQRLMTTHGWGQVPVVEPSRKAIVGVVTRTDLLKRLAAPAAALRRRRNLTQQLESALPAGQFQLIRQISGIAAQLGVSMFIVGGFVRDLILGLPSTDFDLVIEGNAITLARRAAAALGGRVTAHERFGTAKWRLPPNAPLTHLDFVTARTEYYPHPSALPEVEHASIKLDLHRRDFTINTLALCLDRASFGEVLDFWGGERDLSDGLIRILHSISFIDDPTRMLRAARFEQRFGFRIETRTLELLAHALPLLKRVSGDRLRHELDLILRQAEPARHLARLAELNVLEHIHPDLAFSADLARDFKALAARNGQPPAAEAQAGRWAAWLSSQPPAALDAIFARLNFPARLGGAIRQVAALRIAFAQLRPGAPFGEMHAVLSTFDSEPLQLALALCTDAALCDRIHAYLHRLAASKPVTTGDDLKALGLPPGPRYGELLRQLQLAYLEGRIASPEDERALLAQLVGQAQTT